MIGKARILASNATVKVKDPFTGFNIKIGEVDKFGVKANTELIKSRSIGNGLETTQLKYSGYDLTFSGGKVDWELARLMHSQDHLLNTTGLNPYFSVENTITYYDGTVETYVFNNVLIFGYDMNIESENEITESFSGYATSKTASGFEINSNAAYVTLNGVFGELQKTTQDVMGDFINSLF
jgi:hypothetical protein